MKKLLYFIMTILMLSSCESILNDPDGKWTPMKWEKTNYQTNGKGKNYIVPEEGGTYTFHCRNYHSFWISHIHFEQGNKSWEWYEPEADNATLPDSTIKYIDRNYSNSIVDVKCAADSMVVRFKPNTGNERKVNVVVTAGDIFDGFGFVQNAANSTE